jgi:hypothetical protein
VPVRDIEEYERGRREGEHEGEETTKKIMAGRKMKVKKKVEE